MYACRSKQTDAVRTFKTLIYHFDRIYKTQHLLIITQAKSEAKEPRSSIYSNDSYGSLLMCICSVCIIVGNTMYWADALGLGNGRYYL